MCNFNVRAQTMLTMYNNANYSNFDKIFNIDFIPIAIRYIKLQNTFSAIINGKECQRSIYNVMPICFLNSMAELCKEQKVSKQFSELSNFNN